MKTEYIGIDYACGLANIDIKTGIRYGVINLKSCNPDWLAEFAPYYGEGIPDNDNYDFAEPISWFYDCNGIKAEHSSDSCTMFVFCSPVVVKTQFCSPCYPGAGNLDCLCDDGVDTYGLPADCLITEEI